MAFQEVKTKKMDRVPTEKELKAWIKGIGNRTIWAAELRRADPKQQKSFKKILLDAALSTQYSAEKRAAKLYWDAFGEQDNTDAVNEALSVLNEQRAPLSFNALRFLSEGFRAHMLGRSSVQPFDAAWVLNKFFENPAFTLTDACVHNGLLLLDMIGQNVCCANDVLQTLLDRFPNSGSQMLRRLKLRACDGWRVYSASAFGECHNRKCHMFLRHAGDRIPDDKTGQQEDNTGAEAENYELAFLENQGNGSITMRGMRIHADLLQELRNRENLPRGGFLLWEPRVEVNLEIVMHDLRALDAGVPISLLPECLLLLARLKPDYMKVDKNCSEVSVHEVKAKRTPDNLTKSEMQVSVYGQAVSELLSLKEVALSSVFSSKKKREVVRHDSALSLDDYLKTISRHCAAKLGAAAVTLAKELRSMDPDKKCWNCDYVSKCRASNDIEDCGKVTVPAAPLTPNAP